MVRDHEHCRSDQSAVQVSGATQHEHDHEVRGARESEHVEADELCSLREEPARDACHRRADRVDGDEPAGDRRTDRRHAPHVLANAAQREPERRAHDAARNHEHQEQHAEAVKIRGAAAKIERVQAEELSHRHAGQAVRAAGDRRELVRRLEQHETDAKRHHQAREVGAAHDKKAGCESEDRGGQTSEQESADRLAPAMDGEQSGGIGANPEERRMPERNDAGVAQDQIKRNREQSRDQDLAAEHAVIRKDEERRKRQQPEDDLDFTPAVGGQPRRNRGRIRDSGDPVGHARRPYSPAGKMIISTTIRK